MYTLSGILYFKNKQIQKCSICVTQKPSRIDLKAMASQSYNRHMAKKTHKRRPRVIFLPCYRDQRMLDGVAQFASEAHWVLDALYYHGGGIPHSWQGDGILCLLELPCFDPKLSMFAAKHRDIPTVDLSLNDPSMDLPRVLQDNEGIGRMGAEHLISRGCRRLGFVMSTPNSFHSTRCKGFCDTARSAGIEPCILHAGDRATSQDRTWLTRHFRAEERPFGLMAAADFLAHSVTQACETEGLSIPEDVALVGVDNCREICELSDTQITSIDNNTFQHGYDGAKLLHKLMNGGPRPSEPLIVPPGALYVRHSTDIMATRHRHVANAMQYISEHFADFELTPRIVASQVPMSARRLHAAFIRHVGRTVHQEIIHRRIQRALQLVQTTDRKLLDISESSGFSSAEFMSRTFRKSLGQPPSYFRKRYHSASVMKRD